MRVAGMSSLLVQLTCPWVGLATPLQLPQLLPCAGRLRSNNDLVCCVRGAVAVDTVVTSTTSSSREQIEVQKVNSPQSRG